jgi:RHS repeat-associated protein
MMHSIITLRTYNGDITGILDGSLKQVVSYTYDTWGKIVSIKDASGKEITDQNHIGHVNPYRYRSYRYDSETGMYYLQSRYYSPEWGRFINADGVADTARGIFSHNMYIYCDNNPVSRHDPYGEAWFIATAVKSALSKTAQIAAQAAAKATLGFVGGLLGTATIIDISKSNTQSKAQTQTKATPVTKAPQTHTIYTLNNNDGVQYVGRTTNIVATTARHNTNPARQELSPPIPLMVVPDLASARAWEQYYIEHFTTLNNGHIGNNRRNEIRWDKRDVFMRNAGIFTHETYVGP